MKKPSDADVDREILLRIRCEYLEMPGLRLTADQARRLCGVDRDACAKILDELVDAGFLTRGHDNRYSRSSDGSLPAPPFRMARVAAAHVPVRPPQPARKRR